MEWTFTHLPSRDERLGGVCGESSASTVEGYARNFVIPSLEERLIVVLRQTEMEDARRTFVLVHAEEGHVFRITQ